MKRGGPDNSMAFVGAGAGAYVSERAYRFVGAGAGDFDVPLAVRKEGACCGLSFIAAATIGALITLLIAGLAVLATMLQTTFTTTQKAVSPLILGPIADCLVWGDPHIQGFDEAFSNWYGEGEFWLVQSPQLLVQGRFLATPLTNGLAATREFAVGGSSVGGVIVTVGPLEGGAIKCNGHTVCDGAFPCKATCGPVSIAYNGEGDFSSSDAQETLEQHVVHLRLPRKVKMQVLRWTNHVNGKFSVPKFAPGGLVDGACGNFNGQKADDEEGPLKARGDMRVSRDELLFKHKAPVRHHQAHQTISDCNTDKRMHAFSLCRAMEPSVDTVLLGTCVFDVCFGGDQYAPEDSIAEKQSEEAPAAAEAAVGS